jgi:hypothetical protein
MLVEPSLFHSNAFDPERGCCAMSGRGFTPSRGEVGRTVCDFSAQLDDAGPANGQ